LYNFYIMLKAQLGKIIKYAILDKRIMKQAFLGFFGNPPIDLPPESKEIIFSLFNEWLTYDFKLPSGASVIAEYYLKNPDNLSEELLDELKQIISTQIYDYFEIEKVNPGKWVEVWGLFSGKEYRVTEITFSIQIGKQKGSFYNRVAKVNGEYFFVGSNPFILPMTHTDRSRKYFSSLEYKEKLSPKAPFEVLLNQNNQKNDPRLSITGNKIKIKRKSLEKKFQKLKVKYKLKIDFKALVDFVYNESYRNHFADFNKDILKVGMPEEMMFDNLEFFQDLWNYFPHKKLKGKSPAEKVIEFY